MNYTGKQKAELRRLANNRPIMFQIGQAGLTPNTIQNILDNLKKYEVGRVSVLKSCPDSFEEITEQLLQFGVLVVYSIGRVLLMYKENKELKNRIRL
ncbi:MAG: YhbY family RNA-binding protein [Bacilli bacterium]|nr:YhbY family RNA-binding protein [Bacilli bacterium]MBN2877098.1 YhbY family RNA-binding protein [Bacilli bacterium]